MRGQISYRNNSYATSGPLVFEPNFHCVVNMRYWHSKFNSDGTVNLFKKSETKSLLDLSFSRSSRRFTILKSEGEPVYSSLGSAKINFLILLH